MAPASQPPVPPPQRPSNEQPPDRAELHEINLALSSLERKMEALKVAVEGGGARQGGEGEEKLLSLLRRELREERNKVAQLEAEITEHTFALEKSQVSLVKLDSALRLAEGSARLMREVKGELEKAREGRRGVGEDSESLGNGLMKLKLGEGHAECEEGAPNESAGMADECSPTCSSYAILSPSPEFPTETFDSALTSTTTSNASPRELHEDDEIIRIGQAGNANQGVRRMGAGIQSKTADELETELAELVGGTEGDADSSHSSTPHPSRPPSPLPSLIGSCTSRHSAYAIDLLHETVKESNRTIEELREENMRLLMKLAGLERT
ncbi:hypothetical protein BCR35DRAFT_332812 [Leucosporidium creatinivorum]|uniref:Uncharacterized protein n=1 Tax=Leucosporidium creatinivorum TaxID=106004 RepID=A0A1Y2EZL1_9BASI|nr:hypothetical protein BCR35DRAFT_332812 [Leucosporidium creatinivorum]